MFSELDERKKKILQAIIQDYLRTAEPVGSKTISERYHLDISPATVRNEMAELEKTGYIIQPYTSAGRIPSDKGYRFYVDRLMKVKHLTLREEKFVDQEYLKIEYDVEAILHQTLKILTSLLDYATVVLTPKVKVYTSGMAHMLHQPEFRDPKRMETVLEVLEDEEFLVHILRESAPPQGVNIKIGSEIKHKKLKECSLVTSSYKLGTLGIIGPTRMTYSKVTYTVDYISQRLTSLLEEVS